MAVPKPIQGNRSRERRPKNAGRIPEPFLLVIPGLLALGILIMLFIGNSGNSSRDTGYGDLEGRIKRLEQGLARMEAVDRKISQIDERLKQENLLLAERVARLEKSQPPEPGGAAETAGRPRPPEKAPRPEPQKVPDTPEKKKEAFFHQVREGETLFKISRVYGVSLEDLRRWNNLPPGEGIRNGQKLRIEQQRTSSSTPP